MKPIEQEFFYDKGEIGDCVRAITASILELKREDVPHFVKNEPGVDWYPTWENFMISHGIKPIMISGPWDKIPKPVGYYLASGLSNRGCRHIIIMWDGKIAHDPHPSKDGLLEIENIWILKNV